MSINEFLTSHYLHDSLLTKVVYNGTAVDLTIDFCFWLQEGYQNEEPETGIIQLHFPDVAAFHGPQGAVDSYSILEANYTDGVLTMLLMDDCNDISHELKLVTASGEVSVIE